MRNTSIVPLCLALTLLCACSASRPAAVVRSPLETAIGFYIDGDSLRAQAEFERLLGELKSDADQQTAYLYLGRIHMGHGDHAAAADAFSRGTLLGADIRLQRALAESQQFLRASAMRLRLEGLVTRGQLAAVIDDMFAWLLRPLAKGSGSTHTPATDVGEHWAREYIHTARATGVMQVLPDGWFHPDAAVTRGALYFIVERLAALAGLTADLTIAPATTKPVFPGGMRGLARTGSLNERLSGDDVTAVLYSLSARTGR